MAFEQQSKPHVNIHLGLKYINELAITPVLLIIHGHATPAIH